MSKETEKEFKEIDKFLEWFKDKRPELVVLAKNKERYEEVAKSIETITKLVKESSPTAKVSTELDELLGSIVCFSIISDSIIFEDPAALANELPKATTMEIGSRTDDLFELNFTFDDCYFTPMPK